jgi:hypothetical protein
MSVHLLDKTSEDNTTRCWREQQARGKLQIVDETKQWANKYKSKLLQQTQVDDAPCEVKEFYEVKEILIDFIILYGL